MSVSTGQLRAGAIVDQYLDCRNALLVYFSQPSLNPSRFAGMTLLEVREELSRSLSELDLTHSLVLLAAIEALFRVDFERRCSLRLKDDLSRTFRDWKRSRGNRIRFEEDLLEAWKKQGGLSSNLVSDIRGAMKLRHWLAHGRYWTLKSGRQYDFEGIAALAEALEESRYFQIGRDEMK
jgi:hypothetical protein